jgi:two-component system, OmpR family, sensor histidine kinase TctE
MARLDHLLQHQKRFVRDAAHQLRTPLAVLKTQTQSALRGDAPPEQALKEISQTVDRATELANQMLSLAKVEQLRQQTAPMAIDWSVVLREVALDLAPLIADKDLEFDLQTRPAPVLAHDWMLRELVRNLLHNAIKHSPAGSALNVSLLVSEKAAELLIEDSGSGIDEELKQRLFQPFSAGRMQSGSGLGLAICAEITKALQGEITLDNRLVQDHVIGLDVCVSLPLNQSFSF